MCCSRITDGKGKDSVTLWMNPRPFIISSALPRSTSTKARFALQTFSG